MSTFFALTSILSAIFAVGAIEDCGGHCLGNDNWSMFFVMFGIMIISGVLSLYLQSKESN